MTLSPVQDVTFIKENPQKTLGIFAQEAKNNTQGTAWRCLYAPLDPSITKNPSSKNIAENFLKFSFENTFDVRFFWLNSGHLFVFFQGHTRAVIQNFEHFLKALEQDESKNALDYSFFWQLSDLSGQSGYFNSVLSIAMRDHERYNNSLNNTETPEQIQEKSEENPSFLLDPEQLRQRKTRYKPLLLIVEDDRATRHILQAGMEKYCDIAVACNVEQAVEIYQSIVPNIAFLDIRLPDGNGQDFLKIFKQHDPEAFLLILSGTVSKDIAKTCADAGAAGILAKPAKPEQLLKFINQYNSTR